MSKDYSKTQCRWLSDLNVTAYREDELTSIVLVNGNVDVEP